MYAALYLHKTWQNRLSPFPCPYALCCRDRPLAENTHASTSDMPAGSAASGCNSIVHVPPLSFLSDMVKELPRRETTSRCLFFSTFVLGGGDGGRAKCRLIINVGLHGAYVMQRLYYPVVETSFVHDPSTQTGRTTQAYPEGMLVESLCAQPLY